MSEDMTSLQDTGDVGVATLPAIVALFGFATPDTASIPAS
jgi:hypothetical protein